jgi:hypothetical protein
MVLRKQDAERMQTKKKTFVINPVIQNVKTAEDNSSRDLLK